MSRPLRIEYPDAWYHVMNRGANTQKVFLCPKHYQLFLALLQEIHNKYQVEIHAYCLMNNHYHLLVQTRLPNLSRAIRHLDGIYTQRHNRMEKRDGPLFRGRYKSILVDADNYLLSLSRYIHLNPVAAGITTKPEKYLWSSYRAYISPQIQPNWLNTKITLEQFGNKVSRKKYITFIEEGIDEATDSFFKKMKMPPLLGSDNFAKTIVKKYLSERILLPEINAHKRINKKITSSSIIKAVAKHYKVNTNKLLISKRGVYNKARAMAIYLCCKITGDKLTEIAKIFLSTNYTSISQVYYRFNKRIQKNNIFAQEVYELEQVILSNSSTFVI